MWRRNQAGTPASSIVFDDSSNVEEWTAKLRSVVVSASKSLGPLTSSACAFPLAVLVHELEDVFVALSMSPSSAAMDYGGWVPKLFLELHVAHMDLVVVYSDLLQNKDTKKANAFAQIATSLTFLIQNWKDW